MAYLDPPPFPAPVIVQKDVGGLVSEYEARTEQYRREGREVRLHECRSACTLALSLPNVCVYPSSLLKFHKAYDWNTKIRDEAVSAQLMAAYPAAVQARLGGLTRDYQVLTGAELIALGVRDCDADRTLIARARPPAPPPPASASPLPALVGTIVAALTPAPFVSRPTIAVTRPAAATPTKPEAPEEAAADSIPLPPRRPIDLGLVEVADASEPPLPPRRPADLGGMVFAPPPLIVGAQPILPAGVLTYAPMGR